MGPFSDVDIFCDDDVIDFLMTSLILNILYETLSFTLYWFHAQVLEVAMFLHYFNKLFYTDRCIHYLRRTLMKR